MFPTYNKFLNNSSAQYMKIFKYKNEHHVSSQIYIFKTLNKCKNIVIYATLFIKNQFN